MTHHYLYVIFTVSIGIVSSVESRDRIDYETDIKPILRDKCSHCHGALMQESGLRLDAGRFILSSEVVVPGDPDKSELLQRVKSTNDKTRMPAEGAALSDDQIELLRMWISQGATYPEDEHIAEGVDQHWAFQPINRVAIPAVKDSTWLVNEIDRFVLAKLEARGWQPNPSATSAQLLRRAYLDVIGIPPSINELARYSATSDYQRLIRELLGRLGYGERYARHWLDVVRYADSNGYERDAAKPEVYRYRDYVIRALNGDKPFNRFLLEQLAGDELEDATTETVIATGFNRLGPWDDEPADFALDRFDQLDDILNTTGQAFLGLTIGCARCHNHKFDPLLQTDYYSMVAIFNPLRRPQDGRSELSLRAASPEYVQKLADRDTKIEKHRVAVQKIQDDVRLEFIRSGRSKLSPEVQLAFLVFSEKRTSEQKKLVGEFQSKIDAETNLVMPNDLKGMIAEHESSIGQLRKRTPDVPMGYFMVESSPTPPETRLLSRGNPGNPLQVVPPAVPVNIARHQPTFPSSSRFTSRRRLTLARWMIEPENPLTSRVIVNRVWQWHFGEGLVRTPNDFGMRSEVPEHPELLDWLADWFMKDANWSLKKLHFLIMTSRTYQMSRDSRADYLAEDPENRLLWRRSPQRLEVEAIRDSMLFVSGQLDRTMYGAPMYPYVPRDALLNHADKTKIWPPFDETSASRRTVYAFIKRSLVVPMLEVLDLCDVTQSDPTRNVTTVPTQALTLYNGNFALRQAEHFADRLLKSAESSLGDSITYAYLLSLSREPSLVERESIERFLKRQIDDAGNTPEARRKAFIQLCRVIFNLNEFVYPE